MARRCDKDGILILENEANWVNIINAQELVGKTIVKVEEDTHNVLRLFFSDNTQANIWSDCNDHCGIPGWSLENE